MALVLAGLAVGAVLLTRTRTEQARVTGDYYDATVLSDDLLTSLVDQETAVRGYALTRDPAYLAPYRAAEERGPADFATLQRKLEGSPQALDRLQVAARAAGAWQRTWAEPAIADVRTGGTLSGADLDRGRTLFDAVRREYSAYREVLGDERDEVRDALSRDVGLLFATLVAGALGALGACLALLAALRRWVTGPVEALATETRTVAAGDLHHPVHVEGPPEIERLAADVEAMRRGLLTQLGVLEAAKAEVEASRLQLEEQARELQRSNTELEQFAYVASHDLQEPLRKVASFCQMLARRYEGQLDERADQYIAFAVDGAKRMQQLINDLLAFSRVGRLSSGFADVDLEACLAVALRNLSAALEESGAVVTHDPLPTVSGEAGLLTQVFQNLVGNGVKFRGDEPPRVHLGVERAGDEWLFCCRDNGIGVEPEYAERIFVIFQRLHAKDAYEGTGIGLAMCKKIVEHHGGRIWLDTAAPGGGTTFRFTLPVVGPQEGAATAAPVTAAVGAAAQEGDR
ncbi:HAMP domain-containing protein [Vallicoccus soli]|uniref:histidine kinase n=2 Tax=Vallicoccus soli TaxID=2339232 RepID=A0A3A3Z4Q8_9ACTN|nr:HAMP domain-containing protein [Vallicoccus soli]